MTNSAQAGQATAREDSGGFTHRQILTALSGLLLAILLGALDQTIVSTAMRTIADQLHGQTVQAWATTGYLVASTIAMPLYGKLSDIYGRKPMYLVAIAVFIVGSIGCALSTSMVMLAVARIVQGLGGAGLMSLPTAIIGDMAPIRDRARYFTYSTVVWVGASVIGPIVGGVFAGTASIAGISGWRWAFLINVPLGLLALLTVYKLLKLRHQRVDHRIDYWGGATLALAVIPLLVVAEQGMTWGWGSGISITMYALAAVGTVLFVLQERRMGEEGILPLHMFRRGGITLCLAVAFTIGVGMFGTVTTLPLYLQLVQGMSPTSAGLLIIPLMAGAVVSQGTAGAVIKATGRYKPIALAGLGSMAGGLLGLSFTGPDTPLWVTILLVAWVGLGIGVAITTIMLAVQNAAPKSELGVANASVSLFRQLGASIGVSALLTVMFTVTAARVGALFSDTTGNDPFHQALRDPDVMSKPANSKLHEVAQNANGTGIDLNDTSFLHQLDPQLARPVVDSFAAGCQSMFLVASFVLWVGFCMTWFLKEMRIEDHEKQAAEPSRAEA
ncbi:MDR family MFS transporter [Amycolatopsis silviterrae]|uniref:MDR family MFS transporter n=1 Tax=Amycolatopsis silviterrae TaxID=1656914 RepID=A0ABW5H840_9PSEU